MELILMPTFYEGDCRKIWRLFNISNISDSCNTPELQGSSCARPSLRSGTVLGVQLAANALTGYAFQKLFAYYYGASIEKSIFDIAFSVPTMLIYLSGFGMTHAIVVSLFSRLRSEDAVDLDIVFSSLLNASLLLLIVFMIIAAFFSETIANWLAVGLETGHRVATRQLILWMLPLALTFGISSYLSAVSIAWQLPIGQEILLLFARIAVILWVLGNSYAVPLEQLALILVVTTAVGLMAQWWWLHRLTGLNYRLELDLSERSVRYAVHQFGGFLLVALAAQLAGAYTKRMATVAGLNVVALMGFAISLTEPLGSILGKVLAYQVGQPLAAQIADGNSKNLIVVLNYMLVRILSFCIFIAVIISLLSKELVSLLYGGGAFSGESIMQTAEYVQIMAIGLPAAIILWVVLYPLLGIKKHMAAAMYVTGYIAQIVFIMLLFDSYQGVSIAWSYAFCLWFQAIIGIVYIYWTTLSRRLAVTA